MALAEQFLIGKSPRMQAAITAIRNSVWLRAAILVAALAVVGWFALPPHWQIVLAYMFGPGLLIGAAVGGAVGWISFKPWPAVAAGVLTFVVTTLMVIDHPPNF